MQQPNLRSPLLTPDKLEARKSQYRNTWKTGLWAAPIADPLCCCVSTFCTYCAAYVNHKRALHNDMTRYICCAGACPCSGKMNEQSCPEFCLACEVFWCFAMNVSATRWMIQDEMHIQNTQCDNCLIGTMIAAQYLACLCSCVACWMGIFGVPGAEIADQGADIMNAIAQALWCSVCACMQTQHHVEMNERDKNLAAGGPANPQAMHMQPPPVQQIPMQGKVVDNGMPQGPPPGYPQGGPPPGYPAPGNPMYGAPPPAYGAPPPSGYPGGPPQYGGYPPQGYPPQEGYPMQAPYPQQPPQKM